MSNLSDEDYFEMLSVLKESLKPKFNKDDKIMFYQVSELDEPYVPSECRGINKTCEQDSIIKRGIILSPSIDYAKAQISYVVLTTNMFTGTPKVRRVMEHHIIKVL